MAADAPSCIVPHWSTLREDRRLLGPAAEIVVLALLFKLAISDGGRDATALVLAQALAGVFAAVLLWTGRSRLALPGYALLGMALAAGVSAAWSVRPEASLREALLWTTYFSLVVLSAAAARDAAAARRVADGGLAVAGWLCLVALFMFWGAGQPGMRWYATFYWPNPFASFLLLVVPLALIHALRAASTRAVLVHGAAAALLGVAFVLTYSRGAWLSLAAVLPLVAVLLRPRSWMRAVGIAAIVALVVTVAVIGLTRSPRGTVPPAGSTVAARAASIVDPADPSIAGRLQFWRAALRIFTSRPLLGSGAGTFGVMHTQYQQDPRFFARDAHSLYAQTAAELGLVGLVILLVLILSIGVQWIRAAQMADGDGAAVVTGVGVGVLAFFLHSGVEMNFAFPAAPALAFVFVGLLDGQAGARSLAAGRGMETPQRSAARFGAMICGAATLAGTAAFWGHTQYTAGQRLSHDARWVEAARRAEQAVRWHPLHPDYRAAQAVFEQRLAPPDFSAADAQLRTAARLDRMNASHPLQAALLHAALPGGEAEAETLVRRALALDPHNRPQAYVLLASLRLRAGDTAGAEAVYREATARYRGRRLAGGLAHILLWPEVAGLNQAWAAYLTGQGRTGEAQAVLRAVIAEDPFWAPAYADLAAVLVRTGRRAAATAALREGLRRAPNNEEFWIRWTSISRPRRHER